jgi:hypothetical protein
VVSLTDLYGSILGSLDLVNTLLVIFILVSWSGVRLKSTWYVDHLAYLPAPDDG